MAIAVLAVSPADSAGDRHLRAFRVAFGFAAGHAIFLTAVTGIILLAGWTIPPLVERGGEVFGGMLLVGLGLVGLWGTSSGRFYGHTHETDRAITRGWHLHVGSHHPRAASHSDLPTLLGAAFAISSLRSLSVLQPFGEAASNIGAQSLVVVLTLIVAFAAGVLLSMCLFGIVLARLLSTRVLDTLGRGAAGVTALGAIVLGAYWMFASAHG